MKKDILTCDICGTIIAGPNSGPFAAHEILEQDVVMGAIPYLGKNREFISLDVCQEDFPEEHFDGNRMELLFDGTVHQGEIFDIADREVIAVVVKNDMDHYIKTCRPEELDPNQRQFIRSAVDSMRQIQQDRLNNNPLTDRSV